MNACEIYERCKSKELITSFNRSGLCVSYQSMKRHRADLAKYCIKTVETNNRKVPLPSHSARTSFTPLTTLITLTGQLLLVKTVLVTPQ